MGSVPTPRLIEAVAGLPEADRALVNLWINRGFDDARLGALTGVDPSAVRTRRERIIAGLAAALDLPEAEVLAALRTMTQPGEVTEAVPAPEGEGSRRNRIRWAGALMAVAAVIAVLLVVLLASGGSSPRTAVANRPASDPGATTAPATTTAPVTTTTATTSTTDPQSSSTPTPPTLGAFAGLPGGLVLASGHVSLLGHGRRLRLRLTVNHLPRPRHGGHYEAWLYSTVLASRPLGRVRPGHTETYLVPAGARRFRFIDVSLQPRGAVNHSGESRLRTANPVRELRRHPRAARAHPRHALHAASSVGPRPAGGHHRGAAGHAGQQHAHRRGSDSKTRSTR